IVEMQQPSSARPPRGLVAGHRAARQPVPRGHGGREHALAQIRVVNTRIPERGDGLLYLGCGGVADEQHLQVGVALREQRGERPVDQGIEPADGGHGYRDERIGIGIGLLIKGTCPQLAQAAAVLRLLVEDRAEHRLHALLERDPHGTRVAGELWQLGAARTQLLQHAAQLGPPTIESLDALLEALQAIVQRIQAPGEGAETPRERLAQPLAHHAWNSRAGTPCTREPAATSRKTTAPAATVASGPILVPLTITAPMPTVARSPSST